MFNVNVIHEAEDRCYVVELSCPHFDGSAVPRTKYFQVFYEAGQRADAYRRAHEQAQVAHEAMRFMAQALIVSSPKQDWADLREANAEDAAHNSAERKSLDELDPMK